MTDPTAPTTSSRSTARRQLLLLLAGFGAVVLGTVIGGSGAAGKILEPPFPLGLMLGAAAAIIGVVVLLQGAARIRPAREDPRELIRGVRLAFVAVGCFAAAGGWFFGTALPIIAGLIIIGIDIIETTFLLMLTAVKPSDPDAAPTPAPVPDAPEEPAGS
ncbi:MAG: hypothetical protein U0869_25590 [Chloroflexota bacterium]